MSFLILIRHGQSIWNLENKFTGWVDVDLSEQGKIEAEKAGFLIKEKKIEINFYYSSSQLRANNTLKIIQNILCDQKKFSKAWQLNERHYGSLTGLNKTEMVKKLGISKVHEFRRSWDTKPEPLDKKSPYHPLNIKTYKGIPKNLIPDTESLKDTYDRAVPYFERSVIPALEDSKNVLVAAHGNSLRAIVKYIENISETDIVKLEIATGDPIIYSYSNGTYTRN